MLLHRHHGATLSRRTHRQPVVKQTTSKSRSFKSAWSLGTRGRGKLLTTAAHEVCHLVTGATHNEDHSNFLTGRMAKVIGNRQVFGKIFNAPVTWHV